MDPERRDAASIWGGMEGPAAKEEPRAAMCIFSLGLKLEGGSRLVVMGLRGVSFSSVAGCLMLFLLECRLVGWLNFQDLVLVYRVCSGKIDVRQLGG